MTRSLTPALVLFAALSACTDADSAPAARAEAHLAPQAPQAQARDERPTAPAPSRAALALEEHTIPDPARGGMAAYRVLVPEGWTLEGGVTQVGPAYHMIPTISDVTVRAPDGRGARFYSLLEYGWADGLYAAPGTPYDGRPLMPLPATLGEHWQRVFELFPKEGATDLEIVAEEVRPAATKRLRELLAPLYESTRRDDAQLRPMGRSKEFSAEARRLVIRYSEGGERIEATIFADLTKSIYRGPGGYVSAAMWTLDHAYCVFGPAGGDTLADPVLAAVVRSRREVPEWQLAIQRWYAERNQQLVAEGQARVLAAARAAVTTRTTQSQDLLDISFAGWKSRNAASDAGQANLVNAIHERTTYAQPAGGTVDLPSYYRNVYTDGQGHYVLHDDANWEINADPTWNAREWTRMTPQR